MICVELADFTAECDVIGEGEPVVFLHANAFTPWYRPLIAALRGRSRISYRRAPRERADFGIAADAACCEQLLVHLGVDRPHLIGHSYGGLVALAIAGHTNVAPRSLALLEPATSGLLPPTEALAALAPLLRLAQEQGPQAAMDAFLRTVCGDDGPDLLDRLIPGAFEHALANAAEFYSIELPAAINWRYDRALSNAITCPVLNIRGANSEPRFSTASQIIQSSVTHARPAVVPEVGHLLMAADPNAVASLLEDFWSSVA